MASSSGWRCSSPAAARCSPGHRAHRGGGPRSAPGSDLRTGPRVPGEEHAPAKRSQPRCPGLRSTILRCCPRTSYRSAAAADQCRPGGGGRGRLGADRRRGPRGGAAACQQRRVDPEDIRAMAEMRPHTRRRGLLREMVAGCGGRRGGAVGDRLQSALSPLPATLPDLQERRRDAASRWRYLDAYQATHRRILALGQRPGHGLHPPGRTTPTSHLSPPPLPTPRPRPGTRPAPAGLTSLPLTGNSDGHQHDPSIGHDHNACERPRLTRRVARGDSHPPGSHRTERDSLPSLRSSHLIR